VIMQAVPNPAPDSQPVDLTTRRLVDALVDLLVASDPYGISDPDLISARHEARVVLRRHLGEPHPRRP